MREGIEKHFNQVGRSLTKFWVLIIILFLASAAAISGLWFSFRNENLGSANLALSAVDESGETLGASTEDPESLTQLANNLKNTGIILYGFDTNGATKRQLSVFGQAVNTLDYVECNSALSNSNAEECTARGVNSYPTWIKDGQKIVGFQTPESLEKLLSE